MMGYSHAVTGAAGWLALTSASGVALGVYDPGSTGIVLAGSVLCAGAAMAPDADHKDASIAHSLPPITKWIAQGVGAVSGGHRNGTHSFVGIAIFCLFTYAMSFWTATVEGRTVALGSGLIAVFLVAFATKTLGLHRSIGAGVAGDILGTTAGPWIVALGTAGVATWYFDERWSWLPLCMGVGTFIHVLGDSLTIQGVPWLWPWNPKPPQWVKSNPILKELWLPNGYFRLPLLGRTGNTKEKGRVLSWKAAIKKFRAKGSRKTSWQETLFITFVTIYTVYLLAYEALHLSDSGFMLF